MAKFEDLSGRTFDYLYVMERTEDHVLPKGKRKSQYLCKCACGKELKVLRQNLISGHTKSCGCMFRSEKQPIIPKQYDGCPHNQQGIICNSQFTHKCKTCGWNPCNTKLKRQRLQNLNERMRGKCQNQELHSE